MPELHKKFADDSIRGQTNYEEMVKYFAAVRSRVEKEAQQEAQKEEKALEMNQINNQRSQQPLEPERHRGDNLNSR